MQTPPMNAFGQLRRGRAPSRSDEEELEEDEKGKGNRNGNGKGNGESYENWSVLELKTRLRGLGLNSQGNKQVLIAKCKGHDDDHPQVLAGCSVSKREAIGTMPGLPAAATAKGDNPDRQDVGAPLATHGHAYAHKAPPPPSSSNKMHLLYPKGTKAPPPPPAPPPDPSIWELRAQVQELFAKVRDLEAKVVELEAKIP